MLTFTPRLAAASSILSMRYCSFFAGGLLRYNSGDNHPISSQSLSTYAIATRTIQYPDGLCRLLQRPGHSPHVAACIHVPLDIISFPLRTEAHVTVVQVCIVGAWVAFPTLVGMAVFVRY